MWGPLEKDSCQDTGMEDGDESGEKLFGNDPTGEKHTDTCSDWMLIMCTKV